MVHRKTATTAAVLAVILSALPGLSFATKMIGDLAFSGRWLPVNLPADGDAGSPDDILNADKVVIITPSLVSPGNGAFSGLLAIDPIDDLMFDPLPAPLNLVWKGLSLSGNPADEFTFTLNTLRVNLQTVDRLVLVGSGTAVCGSCGLEQTDIDWAFDGRFDPGSGDYIYNAGIAAPTPGVLALALLGLVGLGIRGRRG